MSEILFWAKWLFIYIIILFIVLIFFAHASKNYEDDDEMDR